MRTPSNRAAANVIRKALFGRGGLLGVTGGGGGGVLRRDVMVAAVRAFSSQQKQQRNQRNRMNKSKARPKSASNSKQTPKKGWKSIEEVWDNASVVSDDLKSTGFKSLEDMLEFGRIKKAQHDHHKRNPNTPPPQQVPSSFVIPKHELRAAIEDADNEALIIPNTEKFMAEERGVAYQDDPFGDDKLDVADVQQGKELNITNEGQVVEKESTETRAARLAQKLEKLLPIEVEIESRMYNKIVPGGRKESYSTLMVAGNGKGYAGYGYGKAPTPENIKNKANVDLLKNLIFVPLYQGRTIWDRELHAKFQGLRMVMWRRSPGHGIQAAPILKLILRCFGITDVTVKLIGTKTRTSMVKCLFKLLGQAKCHETDHRDRGLVKFEPWKKDTRLLSYKKMMEQQERVKAVIGSIPEKYGIPMSPLGWPAPTKEELIHYDKQEDAFTDYLRAEKEKKEQRLKRLGFDTEEMIPERDFLEGLYDEDFALEAEGAGEEGEEYSDYDDYDYELEDSDADEVDGSDGDGAGSSASDSSSSSSSSSESDKDN